MAVDVRRLEVLSLQQLHELLEDEEQLQNMAREMEEYELSSYLARSGDCGLLAGLDVSQFRAKSSLHHCGNEGVSSKEWEGSCSALFQANEKNQV
uniref:Uncharacterized protein n=1 Tax=Sphaerodactylus townsendi TaxID=933632 RepID=A0ACB8G0C4_9SAUR